MVRKIRDMRYNIVILTGGSSPKIEMLSNGIPKSYIPILGRPLIRHILDGVSELNPENIIIVSDRIEYAKAAVNDLIDIKNITIAEQKEPGILGAFRSIYKYLDERDDKILIIYGDIIVNSSAYRSIISSAEEDLDKEDFGGVFLGVAEEPRKHHWLIESDEHGIIRSVMPKTVEREGYIAGGIYFVKKDFIEYALTKEEVHEVFNTYVKRWRVKLLHWGHYWIDIGSPWDLLHAVYAMLNELRVSRISFNAKISDNVTIEGPVIIEDGAEIDHFTIIRGPVYIGRKVFIGAHSFIRNYSSLEEEVFISSYSEINRSFLMPRSTIGRNSYIGFSIAGVGSVIEPNVATKTLVQQAREEAYRIIRRGREYSKLGAVIYAGARVVSGKIIEPGEEIEKEI